MKHGLGRVDLNHIAQLALQGLTANPERDIAALLESHQQIERETRLALAKALRGGAKGGAEFQLRGHGKATFYDRLRRLKAIIKMGREVLDLRNSLSPRELRKKIEKDFPLGEKSIEKGITLSRKLDYWIAESRASGSNHSDAALEFAFLYAQLIKSDPATALKSSVEAMSSLIAYFELRLEEAEGLKLDRRKT